MRNRISKLRARAGLNQRDLAKKIGVSVGSVSNWERGERKVTVEDALKLAELFGVSLDYLALGDTGGLSLSQHGYTLTTISRQDADELLQCLDMIAKYEEDIYLDICEEIHRLGRKLMARHIYSQK